MSFRTNLQYLRAECHMTQEQLAMLLGVSRQSVTKWEAEKSYPEMDKLIKMCQISNARWTIWCRVMYPATVSPLGMILAATHRCVWPRRAPLAICPLVR